MLRCFAKRMASSREPELNVAGPQGASGWDEFTRLHCEDRYMDPSQFTVGLWDATLGDLSFLSFVSTAQAQDATAPLSANKLDAPVGDLSLMSLFLQAHIVVKLVVIGLVLASVWTWAIILEKLFVFRPHTPAVQPFRADVLVGPVAGGALCQHRCQTRTIPWPRCSLPPCASGSAARRARYGMALPVCRCGSRRSWM